MSEQAIRAHLRLEGTRLIPRASDVRGAGGVIDEWLVSMIVGRDTDVGDVLDDWAPDAAEELAELRLRRGQRRALQRSRLFLRNRRIVCGYELLDRDLRAKLAGPGGGLVPPTWLTVGKWTARTIGDVLDDNLYLAEQERAVRRLARRAVRYVASWRTIPMSRILLLGNREIFAQVAGTLVQFVHIDFDATPVRTFEAFVGAYGPRLLGRFDPDVPDELLFPIRATARDPLSDAMLRGLYCYYRAIDAVGDDKRSWVLAANLYLAAYEQVVAQTYVDLSLAAFPGRLLDRLLRGPVMSPAHTAAFGDQPRPREMLLEQGFAARMLALATAALTTRFILTLGVGRLPDGAGVARTFAPAHALREIEGGWLASLLSRRGPGAPDVLRRAWFALDRAGGISGNTRVRDWRSYPARISYVCNVFAASVEVPEFLDRAFTDAEIDGFLAGTLPGAAGVELRPSQLRAARRILDAPGGRDAPRRGTTGAQRRTRHPADGVDLLGQQHRSARRTDPRSTRRG